MNRVAQQVSFFAPAAVMSAWATVMLHTIWSGQINHLLSPLFRNYVLVAAVVLIVLSVLYVLLYQPSAQESATSLAPANPLRQLGRWLVLLLPLIAASVLSPSALSSTTMNNRSSTAGVAAMPSWNEESKAKAKEAVDADPNQAVPVEVTDLLTIARTPAQLQAFDGRKIRTVGLFAHQPDNPPKLVRWIMFCCAADAQPAAVEMSGNTTGAWKDEQWLEVIGTAHFTSTLGHVAPSIEVDSIKPTQEPDEPFLSP